MSRKYPIPAPPFVPKPPPPPAPPKKRYPYDLPPASSGTPMPKCKPPKKECKCEEYEKLLASILPVFEDEDRTMCSRNCPNLSYTEYEQEEPGQYDDEAECDFYDDMLDIDCDGNIMAECGQKIRIMGKVEK